MKWLLAVLLTATGAARAADPANGSYDDEFDDYYRCLITHVVAYAKGDDSPAPIIVTAARGSCQNELSAYKAAVKTEAVDKKIVLTGEELDAIMRRTETSLNEKMTALVLNTRIESKQKTGSR